MSYVLYLFRLKNLFRLEQNMSHAMCVQHRLMFTSLLYSKFIIYYYHFFYQYYECLLLFFKDSHYARCIQQNVLL